MNPLSGQGFLLSLLAICLLGLVFPNVGNSLNPQIPWLVAVTMFFMGAGQDLLELWNSLRKIRAITLSLANNFLVMPLLSYALGVCLFSSQPVLFAGMIILGSAPTTLASSIVWTRVSGGNTALALVLTVCSTVSSVLCVPAILEISLGRRAELPATDVLLKLLLVIVVPVLVGQLSRHLVSPWHNVDRATSLLGHVVVLAIVFTAVSRSAIVLSLELVLYIGLGASLLNFLISFYAYYACKWASLPTGDGIAVLFASSQKTLTVGLMIGLMYFGPLATLPALVYHILQQFSASALSQFVKRKRMAERSYGASVCPQG